MVSGPAILTDERGRFVFGDLPAGTFLVTSTAARDGRRFLASRRHAGAEGDPTPSPIVVVTNWRDGIGK